MKKHKIITTLFAFLFANTLIAQITFEKFYSGVGEAIKVEEHEDGGFTLLDQHAVPWPGFGYTNSSGLYDVMPTQDGGLISSGFYYYNYGNKRMYLLKTTQSGLITSLDEKLDENPCITFSPNPFSHTAHISYKVLNASITKISVIDLHGRLVSLIVDDLLEPGTYNISMDASGIPAGIYLCMYENGNHQVTIKVIKQ
jgi:hypothetical protein